MTLHVLCVWTEGGGPFLGDHLYICCGTRAPGYIEGGEGE